MDTAPTLSERIGPYLKRIAPESAVFSVNKLTGDASNREYFRVTFEKETPFRTLIVMSFNPKDAFKSEEASGGASGQTLPFIEVLRYLERLGMPAPKLYLDEARAGLLFLEDLGDELFFNKVIQAGRETRREWYRRAIELLVQFQSATRRCPDPDSIAFKRSFDYNLLLWECDHYLEYGLEALYGLRLPDSERAAMRREFDRLCRELGKLPRILVHRDFQSRNLMVRGEALALIDFQDALIGPEPYDLVALLRDSYVELESGFVEEMIRFYLERRADASGAAPGFAEFRKGFLLQTVQRKLKDAGRFVFIDRVKQNPAFLPHIPASLSCVRWAFSGLPEFNGLADRIGRYEERIKP